MAPLLCGGCICTYTACDFDDFECCCKGKGDCLCLTGEHCVSVSEPSLGLGMVTNENNKECCKIALWCCTCGLKTPETLCTSATHYLCIKEVAALPCHDEYLKECVCASCCLSCAPKCGCGQEAPECSALSKDLALYGSATKDTQEEPAPQEIERD